MSKKLDRASQGIVDNPKALGKQTRVAEPDGVAIIRSIGRAVNATDRAQTKPRPPQRVPDKQNPYKG